MKSFEKQETRLLRLPVTCTGTGSSCTNRQWNKA